MDEGSVKHKQYKQYSALIKIKRGRELGSSLLVKVYLMFLRYLYSLLVLYTSHKLWLASIYLSKYKGELCKWLTDMTVKPSQHFITLLPPN